MPNLSNVKRTQPISWVPLHDEYIAIRGTSASCIGDGRQRADSAAAVRPSCSTAARTAARSAGGATTNDPAGNSTPSAVKLFSAIFIGTFAQLVAERDHVVRAEVRDRQAGGARCR